MDETGVQQQQDMPDDPEYPGEGPTYDTINPENNVTIRDTLEHKNMFYIEDNHMNQALCKLFLSLFSLSKFRRGLNGKSQHEVQGQVSEFL